MSESESDSDSDCNIKPNKKFYSDSESDSDSDIQPKIKKTVKAKVKEIKWKLSDKFNDKIEKMLNEHKYDNLIEEVKNNRNISEQNVINILQKFDFNAGPAIMQHKYDIKKQQNWKKFIEIIEIIFNNINITEKVCIEMLKVDLASIHRYEKTYFCLPFSLTDTFKEATFELLNTKKIKYFNFYIDDDDGSELDFMNENEKINYFQIILMTVTDLDFVKDIYNCINIVIKDDFLKYAKTKAIKDFLKDKMIKNFTEAKNIVFSDLDKKLLEQKSKDSIDDFIAENNYKINENTIILSCQKNIKFGTIQHLMASKINFTENGINEIIKSYRNNKNISKLIVQIKGYYNFTQNNYYEMVHSPFYHEIFSGDILNNVSFDDKITNLFLDAIKINENEGGNTENKEPDYYDELKKYNKEMQEKFIIFLNNIREFAAKSEENKNNILALYCFHGDDKEIVKFVKDFKCKMTTKSLKFLYKNKGNIKKKTMELFIKDAVVPDFDVLLQYIDTYSRRKEQQFLFDLLNIT